MIPKALSDIAAEDIVALQTDRVGERRTLDYKRELPNNTPEAKREFLADVCSFANAAGGDIIFGVEESKGTPVALPGLPDINLDAAILRLEEMARSGIDPRIPGIHAIAIEMPDAHPVVVIRIPRSWRSPHLVSFKGSSRFYSRNSKGKYQLDATEIRSAFIQSEQVTERIRRWREDRVAMIAAEQGPVPLTTGARFVLHVIPIKAFATSDQISVATLQSHANVQPMGRGGWSHFINLDGHVTYGGRDDCTADSYCQFFRRGMVEAVDARFVSKLTEKVQVDSIASISFEQSAIKAASAYFSVLKKLSIDPPFIVTGAVLGAKGASMSVREKYLQSTARPIDRDVLLLPEELVEAVDSAATVLRPLFDSIWNACGWPASLNYDEDGEWRPNR